MNFLKRAIWLLAAGLVGCAAPQGEPAPDSLRGAAPFGIGSDALALRANPQIGKLAPKLGDPSSARTPFDPVPLTPMDAPMLASRSVVPMAPPVDLWDRIRRGYAMPDLESDLVRDREQWYSSRPDYLYRMTERSKKYLFHIVEELELRNMPTELALLPFIESAFNPQAVSVAKAAGMWQFMPATGKYFELKQNAFRDDRRDVLASTRAALDYLQKLYGMFGDWHLALAAYNWGEGSVGRAIAKNQRNHQPTGYLQLNMPMETRFYVPKLQAVKNIVSRPQAYNSQLPTIDNHPYFQSVTIQRDIDVTLAARLAEVPLDDFKALNPSVNRPVILAAGTPQILLPWDNAEVFQANLESYGGARLASWTVWVAPSTMRPADAAKRVGMTEADFRSVNAIPPRVVIRAGSSLLVPRSEQTSHDVAVQVADNGQLSLAPEVVLKQMVVKAGKAESVASIARRYRLNSTQVAQWNKLAVTESFKPGQSILLYFPPKAYPKSNTASQGKPRAKAAAAPGKRKPATPVVKR
jgi:membrane-bound lytic murein transglycosylase D